NICPGDSLELIPAVTGGTSPYTYLWNTGSTGEWLFAPTAGNYSVTVTDNSGCTATDSINISMNPAITTSVTVTNVTCYGGNNGTATVAVTGGTSPVTYIWNTGVETQGLASLQSGSYNVTVTDAAGCTAIDTAIITQPPAITLTANITNCTAGNNGVIDLTVTGGVSPYTYNWNNGMHTQDIGGLTAGSYSVTVTDNNGCTAVKNFTVSATGCTLVATASATPVSCFGGNDGTAAATVTGGTTPYTFIWNTGVDTQGLAYLQSGSYTVTVTGAGGCIDTAVAVVTQPAALGVTIAKTDASCNQNNGSATTNVTGGVSPYQYNWNTGATSATLDGLGAGYYSVTITDANGCESASSASINNDGAPVADLLQTDISCHGAADGEVSVNVTGGITPYSYSWNSGCTDVACNVSAAGTYIVTVTDSAGCMAIAATYITEPQELELIYIVEDEVLGNDGSIQTLVSGGTAPYFYLWNTGAETQSLASLQSGFYFITITDANGCTLIDTITVPGSPCDIALSFTQTNILCAGASYGSIDLTVSGGTAPFTYHWNNSATSEDLMNIPAGTYYVTVTDNLGCPATETIEITEPAPLDIVTDVTPANCGEEDGEAEALVSGGVSPYIYTWSTGSDSTVITDLTAGYYMLTVTDNNGCKDISVVVVGNSGSMNITGSVTDVNCNGGATGAVDIVVTGGNTPYSIEWSNGAASATFSGQDSIIGLTAGMYDVQVTDVSGCVETESFTITEPDAIIVTVTSTPASCGFSTGSAYAAISGGTAPYSLLWSTGGTSTAISDLPVGTYSLAVTDANMCMKMKMFSVSNDNGPVVSSAIITETACDDSTGTVDITISGGSMPFVYEWSDGTTGEDLTGLAEGDFSVTITDNDGCVTVENYFVPTQVPLENPICMVFVDSISGFNRVVWEKVQDYGVSHYNIYRENNMAGVFNLLATVPYDDLSEYEDPYADPVTRPWKYKISAVDSCGNESPLSDAHKTLHLTINEGLGQTINLIWDSYEGFDYYSFYVHRHTNQTGWDIIDTLPSWEWTYVDDPASQGQLYYMVSVVKDTSCVSTGTAKATGGPYSHSTSNIDEYITPVTINEPGSAISGELLIYPNPFSDMLNVEFSNGNHYPYTMRMYNVTGKEVMNMQNIRSDIFSIDRGNLKPGYYTIELTGNETFRGKALLR
ncbi:MAG: T9SS type A sorting domain-containing protein, partial [Bacteroidetes bacterium]|nr:T9SS type A sorting domain-containing protein [Bacteroidota bacterium]